MRVASGRASSIKKTEPNQTCAEQKQISDQSGPRLTTTVTGAVDKEGSSRNWVTVTGKTRAGK